MQKSLQKCQFEVFSKNNFDPKQSQDARTDGVPGVRANFGIKQKINFEHFFDKKVDKIDVIHKDNELTLSR
jgi:hypothetical protein